MTHFVVSVVLLEGMLAQALKIVSAMSWNVLECLAFAAFGTADRFTVDWIQVLMFLKPVIAEAFGFGADHFAFVALGVFPAEIQAVGVFGFVWELRSVWLHKVEV